ncbi:tetratricopeptide repeat protein [Streptomyces sp. TRM76130]|nr:tetratricopeptide repeat protein [Streptomyces sp. TRM76130]
MPTPDRHPHALALLRHAGEPSAAADALAVVTRLSVALHRTGDYLSAWETSRTAAELGRRRFGADDRMVLAVQSRAGRALFRLGRFAEAESLLPPGSVRPRRPGSEPTTPTPWTRPTACNSSWPTSAPGRSRSRCSEPLPPAVARCWAPRTH